MLIYIDNNYRCYTQDDGTREPHEVSFFDGKCKMFVEGYLYVPQGCVWTNKEGRNFIGEIIMPWRDYALLEEFQAQYEAQLAETEAIIAENEDMKAALAVMEVEPE